MTIASAHAVSGHDAAALAPEFVRIKNVDKIYKARGRALKTVDSISRDLHGVNSSRSSGRPDVARIP